MGIRERSAKRRRRIVAHRAASFEDAEKWDLDFWQHQTPGNFGDVGTLGTPFSFPVSQS